MYTRIYFFHTTPSHRLVSDSMVTLRVGAV